MRILITGGAGFIGSHTADALLEKGHSVRVLDLLDPQIHGDSATVPAYLNPAVEFVRGDVRDVDTLEHSLRDVDVVYHFASLTGVGQSMYDLSSYVDTNCLGTARLLEVIAKGGVKLKRFVLSSSRAVYGEGAYACEACGDVRVSGRNRTDLENGEFRVRCPVCSRFVKTKPVAEALPEAPISVYAWTKKHQEDLCKHCAQTFALPVTILRYFNVYGSRQSLQNPYTGVVSIFYSRFRAGKPVSLYEGGLPRRDFVHVSDVVRANLFALDVDVQPGAVFNVGSGEEVTIKEVAEVLGSACGCAPQLLDRGEYRVGDIYSCCADLTQAGSLLGYAPSCSFSAGMAEFVSWADTQEAVDGYDSTVKELDRHGLFGRAAKAPCA